MPPTGSFTPLPYGCHDVRVYPLTGETVGSGVDLPVVQLFSFEEAEDFTSLRGDDGLAAVHGQGPQVNWELGAGGISFDAVKIMYGGTITETGVWSNGTGTGVRSYTKKGDDQRPYFRVEGQAISDSGGDVHAVMYRAKAQGTLTGRMDESAFWITGARGVGLPQVSDKKLYTLTQNEQVTPITG
jgi:hypothetical protein